MKHDAVRASCRRAQKQRRGKYAARCPGTERQRSGDQLRYKQENEKVYWELHAGEHVLNRGISDAFHIVVAREAHKEIQHEPHRQHSNDVLHVVSTIDTILEEVLESVNGVNEQCRNKTGDHTKNGIGDEHLRIGQLKVCRFKSRDGERWVWAKEELADVGGRRRSSYHWHQRPRADFVHDDLYREQHAANRSIERGCDSPTCASRDECDNLPSRQAQELSHGRTKRRTNLNDGPLTANGSTAPDRQRGCQCFDDRHNRTNDSFVVENSVDDFRYAVTLRLWSEVLHQENHSEGPDDRDKNHKRSPGASWCMRVRVIRCGELAQKEEIVKDPDKSPECHGSQTCHDPNQQRERPQACRPDSARRRCCAVSSQNSLPKRRLDGSNAVLSSLFVFRRSVT